MVKNLFPLNQPLAALKVLHLVKDPQNMPFETNKHHAQQCFRNEWTSGNGLR